MNTPSNAGKEHNPDGLTPEQVGEGWRLLNVGEFIKSDDEYWDPYMRVWHPVLRLRGLENKTLRRTTPPTRDAKCPKCGGKGWIFKGHGEDEQCDCIFVDPSTQSQEGETPETDAVAMDSWSPDVVLAPLDFTKSLERRLTAAQRENDRLRSEVAGLKADKERLDWLLGVVHREGIIGLTNFLWSMVDDDPAREPDEEPEDDPERLSPTLDRAATEEGRRG